MTVNRIPTLAVDVTPGSIIEFKDGTFRVQNRAARATTIEFRVFPIANSNLRLLHIHQHSLVTVIHDDGLEA